MRRALAGVFVLVTFSAGNAQQGTNAPLKPAQLQAQFHSVARGVHVYCPGDTPFK
jgi:hypothetical protein